jgi:hypothetical protein
LQELEEANRILQYEDQEAIEGNVAKQARHKLQDLRYVGGRGRGGGGSGL